jgi:peptide/nickel transport system substrate-binding protein
MKRMKKLFALLLVFALAFSLAACKENGPGSSPETSPGAVSDSGGDNAGTGGEEGEAPANSGRTLNVVAMQDSGTLYPLGATGAYFAVLYSFYEPLLDTRADGTRVWILATSIDPISDIQYTLNIRQGVTFSNGNPLTAEDVMFTMELNRDNPQFALNVKAVDFEKTKVTGDYTIDLWYTEYNAAQEVGMCQMLIMDKESYDEVGLSREPVGTGPYVVEDYVVNSHLLLKAREDYWGQTPSVKSLQYKVINEDAQIVNALETGDLDVASVPIAEVEYVKSLGYDIEIYNNGMNFAAWYSMLPGTPLETKEARWAVSHAINREAISDILFKGMATVTDYPASHGLTDVEDRFFNMHETYSVGYDADRAKTLAEQSGLVGQTLRIITNGATVYNTLAEIIQGDLLEIGVNAEIIPYDQATFFSVMMDANNFEIALFTPSAPSMMAVDIMAMYLTFIPLGWTGPDRDRYGELSAGALATFDEASRSDQFYEALKIFVDYDPWYGLCEMISARTNSADLRGMDYMISGNVYYQYVSFAE